MCQEWAIATFIRAAITLWGDRCAGFDFRQSVQPTLTSANGVFLHNGRVKNDARGIERSLLSMFSTGI